MSLKTNKPPKWWKSCSNSAMKNSKSQIILSVPRKCSTLNCKRVKWKWTTTWWTSNKRLTESKVSTGSASRSNTKIPTAILTMFRTMKIFELLTPTRSSKVKSWFCTSSMTKHMTWFKMNWNPTLKSSRHSGKSLRLSPKKLTTTRTLKASGFHLFRRSPRKPAVT